MSVPVIDDLVQADALRPESGHAWRAWDQRHHAPGRVHRPALDGGVEPVASGEAELGHVPGVVIVRAKKNSVSAPVA